MICLKSRLGNDALFNYYIHRGKENMKNNIEESTIIIKENFDGCILPNTFCFEGTKEQWMSLKKDKIFEDIPCVKCKDGLLIQHI